MNDKANCLACRYFVGTPPDARNVKGGQGGLCGRFPPTPIAIPTPQGIAIQAVNPPVPINHHCGEFVPSSPTFGIVNP